MSDPDNCLASAVRPFTTSSLLAHILGTASVPNVKRPPKFSGRSSRLSLKHLKRSASQCLAKTKTKQHKTQQSCIDQCRSDSQKERRRCCQRWAPPCTFPSGLQPPLPACRFFCETRLAATPIPGFARLLPADAGGADWKPIALARGRGREQAG